jgi:hypothetical protein
MSIIFMGTVQPVVAIRPPRCKFITIPTPRRAKAEFKERLDVALEAFSELKQNPSFVPDYLPEGYEEARSAWLKSIPTPPDLGSVLSREFSPRGEFLLRSRRWLTLELDNSVMVAISRRYQARSWRGLSIGTTEVGNQ